MRCGRTRTQPLGVTPSSCTTRSMAPDWQSETTKPSPCFVSESLRPSPRASTSEPNGRTLWSADVELAGVVSEECAFNHGDDEGLFVGFEVVKGFHAEAQVLGLWAAFGVAEDEAVGGD